MRRFNSSIHSFLFVALLIILTGCTAGFQDAPTPGTDALAAEALGNVFTQSNRNGFCDISKAAVRREWGTLSPADQNAYIQANLCLMNAPAHSGAFAPGARSRYDDFVAQHINLTLVIHATGNFLSWHRYFTYLFEQALRDECGYNGWLPYYNWGKYSHDPLHAPIFSGDPLSLSGNGVPAPHPSVNLSTGGDPIFLPPGSGGGCVTTGPFSDLTINLGGANSTFPILPDVPPNPLPNGLGYNPRCLRRDISAFAASSTTDAWSTALITQNQDIGAFQNVMQTVNASAGTLGVHTGGHYTVGGDPGGDFFASPGDPFFWLHHGMIDRTWWTWQNLDVEGRTYAIAGTRTIFNQPPSDNATLEDALVTGVLGEDRSIGSVMSTVREGLCYVYT